MLVPVEHYSRIGWTRVLGRRGATGAVAEFERAIAAERTAAGVAVAHANGHHPGGPGLTADTIAAAQALDQAGTPRA